MRPLLTRSAHVLAGGVLTLALVACSDDDGGGTAGDDTEVTSTDDTEAPSDDTTVDTSAATDETVRGGTTDDTGAVEGSVAAGDEAVCEALRPISEHDAATGPLIDGGDWGEIQSFLLESEADVVAAYEETAELAPELADDLHVLRDLTVEYTAAAEEAPDLDAWISELTALIGEHPEAGQAGIALDTWAVEHCGFSTGGN